MGHFAASRRAAPGPGWSSAPRHPSTSGDGLDEQANSSPGLARAGRRTPAGGRNTAGASAFPWFLPGLQGSAPPQPGPPPPPPPPTSSARITRSATSRRVPDQPVDVPRARVGKPELHGRPVPGSSRLRKDPAPAAFLHRQPEPHDEGRRHLRARQRRQPAGVQLSPDAPSPLFRGRIVRRTRPAGGTR